MADSESPTQIYVAYWLYRVDPKFRRLSEMKREQAKKQFLHALDERDATVTLRGVYSFAGLRADADLMLWVHGEDLDAMQRLSVELLHSGLGKYLRPVETYLGVTTPARYDPGHMPAFISGVSGAGLYQRLPVRQDGRVVPATLRPPPRANGRARTGGPTLRRLTRKAGADARAVGARSRREKAFPRIVRWRREQRVQWGISGARDSEAATQAATSVATEESGGVLASTVDSFGLGDFEFILANESDDPSELCRMMMDLRATEVRRYTKLDTPIYLGRLREPAEALAAL